MHVSLPCAGALICRGEQAFQFIVRTVRSGIRGQFPTIALLAPWSNVRAQLAALRHATAAPPEVLTFALAGPLFPPVVGSRNSCGSANQAWCCVGVYAALTRLASYGGLQAEVLHMLETPRGMIPELVAIGLTIVNKQNTVVRAGGAPSRGLLWVWVWYRGVSCPVLPGES